jgi:anti-sigma factor RsiW
MTRQASHPTEDLQAALEGRLSAERRRSLDVHLAQCASCRREMDALSAVRASLAQGLARRPVPADLAARIGSALDAEVARSAPVSREDAVLSRRSLLLGGGALAAAAAVTALLARLRPRDALEAAARDFERFVDQGLALELATDVPGELETFFDTRGLGFPTRVFDFGMMGYRLVGGGVHAMLGRDAALFAYRGSNGRSLLCQMYPGSVSELPAADAERLAGRIRFQVYGRGAVTFVFWQEGPVVCVLGFDGSAAEALDLAAAKAVEV